ncbi:MAG: hypothetical protein ACXVPQ_01860 [Bacteroidia bacterium]
MKPQEIVTVLTELNNTQDMAGATQLKTYPELDPFFDKGMYVENVTQTCLESGKCMITFVFRHYNLAQSKEN